MKPNSIRKVWKFGHNQGPGMGTKYTATLSENGCFVERTVGTRQYGAQLDELVKTCRLKFSSGNIHSFVAVPTYVARKIQYWAHIKKEFLMSNKLEEDNKKLLWVMQSSMHFLGQIEGEIQKGHNHSAVAIVHLVRANLHTALTNLDSIHNVGS